MNEKISFAFMYVGGSAVARGSSALLPLVNLSCALLGLVLVPQMCVLPFFPSALASVFPVSLFTLPLTLLDS